MLKLRGMSDLERNSPPVRLEGKLYAPWSADVNGQTVVVLIDIEGLAGKTVIIEQISAALNRHRNLIEQLASATHKPGDCRVFLDRQELERVMSDAVRSAP
jgi:hypothetical protein